MGPLAVVRAWNRIGTAYGAASAQAMLAEMRQITKQVRRASGGHNPHHLKHPAHGAG